MGLSISRCDALLRPRHIGQQHVVQFKNTQNLNKYQGITLVSDCTASFIQLYGTLCFLLKVSLIKRTLLVMIASSPASAWICSRHSSDDQSFTAKIERDICSPQRIADRRSDHRTIQPPIPSPLHTVAASDTIQMYLTT